MKVDGDKVQEVEVILKRNGSTVSTAIMANTALSRQDEKVRLQQFESIGIRPRMPRNPKISNTSNRSSSVSALKQNNKKSSSLLDRLTIVDVKESSSRKKKGRRKHNHSIQRDHEALPEELLLRDKQDSVSIMPDGFSNSNTSSNGEEIVATTGVVQNEPVLFTFDLMPSYTEVSLQDEETDEGSAGNDTTDANIGDEDDISGIFDELEESDFNCVDQMEEKYLKNLKTNHDDLKKKFDKTKMSIDLETVAALSKLELTSRTRTESTVLLSEIASNDASSQLESEPAKASRPSGFKKRVKHEPSLSGKTDVQVKASRCISFNVLSMFDSM
mmetsp:Transcript_10302/g.24988  ORF Transcript_10302/g.24988 Transcript_10302/m.24988 type:complete len:330 (-) Transcript_10302:1605-2594(-)